MGRFALKSNRKSYFNQVLVTKRRTLTLIWMEVGRVGGESIMNRIRHVEVSPKKHLKHEKKSELLEKSCEALVV